MLNIKKFLLAIGLVPKATTEIDSQGELEVLNTDGKLRYHNGTSASPVVTESHEATLSNKTLTSPVINTGVSGTAIDTDTTLAANSDTKLASQKAVKAYIDEIDTNVNDLITLSGVGENSTNLGAFSGTTIPDDKTVKEALQALETSLETKAANTDLTTHTTASTNVHGIGATASVVGTDTEQTLTNKEIDASLNDISNLTVTMLASGVLDTDLSSVSASDDTLPSAKAVKAYVDSQIITEDQADEILTNPSISGTVGESVQDVLEDHEAKINDLVTLSGVAANATDLGTFTGVTIPDGSDIKEALQAIETELETKAESSDLTTHTSASSNVHGLAVGSSVVGTTDSQALTNKTLTGASVETPIRSDVKQDTLANLTTYAASASNGQIVFATDEKKMFQVVDGELVSIGGAGIVKLTAGENISANDQVYISTGTGNDSGRTAGQIYKADASNDDRADVLGFAPKAITSGAIGEVQTSGNLTGLSGLTAGKVYYTSASTPGEITATPPSANGQWIIPSALAVSASEIVINPVASASAIYITDSETSFTITNNQSSAANVTGLLFDPIITRSFSLEYSIYRQTDTASTAVAQIGQLRGVYNTQSSTWLMSDDFSGQNSGVTFTIQPSGQIQYASTNISGANYVGTLKYNIRKTFGV